MMKTLIFSTHTYEKGLLESNNTYKHKLYFTEKALALDTAYLTKGYEAVSIFSNDRCDAAIIEKLASNGIKYIALRSVGYDHVDLTSAAKFGIYVANVPEYSPYAIAEHGVALLLTLVRKIRESQAYMSLQDFRLDSLMGFDLHGKTVGIIGLGRIGQAYANILNGFGCKILAYDPVQQQNNKSIQISYVKLNKLLKNSDVVILSSPLNDSTRYLINSDKLKRMKTTAIIINTARGSVIDTKALIKALNNKIISGAGLDVYEKEKGLYFHDHRNEQLGDNVFHILRNLPNVILTGHQAFLTHEAINGIAKITNENLHEWNTLGKSSNDLRG